MKEHDEIRIHGLPWFAPTLNRQSANKTELPALRQTNGLQFGGSLNDLSHGSPPS